MSSDNYTHGELLNEGKTKRVYQVLDHPEFLILENKDEITAFDDPSRTVILPGKGECCTITNAMVCQLLINNKLPTAFVEQLSSTRTLVKNCRMLPLEVVMRNKLFGSILKRYPEYAPVAVNSNHELTPSLFELFLKTTAGRLELADQVIVQGLDPLAGEEDPWIANPHNLYWRLRHPKKPHDDPAGDLRRIVEADTLLKPATIADVEYLARQVNRVLKGAWLKIQYHLIDFKIELGITENGDLVVADVIDADSWRLHDPDGVDFSKQSFRDGQPLAQVAEKYQRVVQLVQQHSFLQSLYA